MQVSDLAPFIRSIEAAQVGPMLEALALRLENLVTIGLGYLSLDRESSTLSGGGEPAGEDGAAPRVVADRYHLCVRRAFVGLHPHDVGRLAGLMTQLRDKGNTVLIVEQKPDMIAIRRSMWWIWGPSPDRRGGEVVYEGDFAGLLGSGTLTGNHMKKHQPIKDKVRAAKR